MAESALTLSPGLILAAISAALVVLMLLVVLWAPKTPRASRRKVPTPSIERPAEHPVGMAGAPTAEIERVWSEAVKSMRELEHELGQELTDFEQALVRERREVETKTESLKASAIENRLPLTLYELYEGMRHFPKKSPQAQSSDLEWHAKIGVGGIKVLDTSSKLIPGREVYFTLDGESFSILGTHHRYSQTAFIEISLYDSEDVLLVTVRVRPQEEGMALAEQAVISMKPGDWLQKLLSCRARMDLRHQQVSLLTQHRDVQQLKENFAIRTDFSSPL